MLVLEQLNHNTSFFPNATSNWQCFPKIYSLAPNYFSLPRSPYTIIPFFNYPSAPFAEKPVFKQDRRDPKKRLYSLTRANTISPGLRAGRFLLLAPSNYNPPRSASCGALISTTKPYPNLFLMTPTTN